MPVERQFMHGGVVQDRGTGGARPVDQHAIEHRAAWSDQTGDAGFGPDRHRDLLLAIVKGRRRDHRRAAAKQWLQQAPPRQLHDGRAHQRVGGQRVRSIGLAVDSEHAQPGLGEQHRGRGAGTTRADDDRVVVGFES